MNRFMKHKHNLARKIKSNSTYGQRKIVCCVNNSKGSYIDELYLCDIKKGLNCFCTIRIVAIFRIGKHLHANIDAQGGPFLFTIYSFRHLRIFILDETLQI